MEIYISQYCHYLMEDTFRAQLKSYLQEGLCFILQGYEQKMTDMQNEFDQMRMNKEQVESEMAKLRDQYDQDMAVIDTSVRSPGERG